jgi:glucan-binding YG repeat protein
MKEYTVRADNGNRFWLNEDGQMHCEHGPAVEWSNGSKWYYLNDQCLSRADWEKERFKKPCSGKVVEIDGVKYKLEEV